jgi:hypothetical protein
VIGPWAVWVIIFTVCRHAVTPSSRHHPGAVGGCCERRDPAVDPLDLRGKWCGVETRQQVVNPGDYPYFKSVYAAREGSTLECIRSGI